MKNSRQYQTILFYLLAFLLPLGIMTIVLLLQGIYLGSDTTILASDGFHQYVLFNQALRDTLHGEGSIFYSFTSGLGINFYALSAYYLSSFLSPFLYFFNHQQMPDVLYFFTLVKFGLIGLSSYISINQIYKQLDKRLVLGLSTSLALMSFTTSQLELHSWLDVFILIPIILLGLHRLITGQGRILYFLSLGCLFIQNYYFGYMAAVFLIFWAILQISWDVKKRLPHFMDFTVVSTLSALSSLIVLLPVYLDLKTHGANLTSISSLQTENSWFFDLFAKQMIGSFDTTQYGSIPMIFVGLFPLLLTLLFFTIKSIKFSVKFAYAAFFVILMVSFYLEPLNLFWQGMHAPNMFLHRFAWIFSVVLVYTAAETSIRFKEITDKSTLLVLSTLLLGFSGTFLFKGYYNFLKPIHFILTLEFLLVYAFLLLLNIKRKIKQTVFVLISSFFMIFEMGIHSHYQVKGIANEWVFPSRDHYSYNLTETVNLVKYVKNSHSDFFRMEMLTPQTSNDSMKYGYNGISQFSSVRNRVSNALLDKLGFRSDGANASLRYQNNTIIADSIFGIRYNLSETDPQKFGFSAEKTENSLGLYQNSYAASLAFFTNDVYKDVHFSDLTLDNQTEFLNRITGLQHHYFSKIHPKYTSSVEKLNNRFVVNAGENSETAQIDYTLTVPKDSQLYVALPNLEFTNQDSQTVQITVNNLSSNFTIDNSFSFFTIGYFEQPQTINLSIQFPHNQQVSFEQPSFYRLNTVFYQEAMSFFRNQDIVTKTKGNQVFTSYVSEKDTSILFTIPYDKGWSATLNGQKIDIKRAQKGLMKIDIQKGKGQLVLTFLPNGFLTGCACFFIGILDFLLYEKWGRKQLRLTKKEH